MLPNGDIYNDNVDGNKVVAIEYDGCTPNCLKVTLD